MMHNNVYHYIHSLGSGIPGGTSLPEYFFNSLKGAYNGFSLDRVQFYKKKSGILYSG